MRKMAGLAVMIGAALAAGCKSDNDTVATKPAAQPTNAIFFLGDGMGLNTLTAARIYGVGEEGSLTIDTLPETAFIKTFSHDAQVTDSAPSMAAYMTGVKSNNGVISMDSDATQEIDCSQSAGKPATTLLELAKAEGRGGQGSVQQPPGQGVRERLKGLHGGCLLMVRRHKKSPVCSRIRALDDVWPPARQSRLMLAFWISSLYCAALVL